MHSRGPYRSLVTFCLVWLCSSSMGQVPNPSALRAVQCAACKTSQEADVYETRLDNLGYGPIWREAGTDYIRVFVGRCEALPDALLLRSSLRRNGFTDCFVKSFPNLADEPITTETKTPDAPLVLASSVIGATNQADDSTQTEQDLLARPDMQDLRSALDKDDATTIAAQGMLLASRLSDDDPAKGVALVEASLATIRKGNKAAPALPYLLKVARCEVSADPATRLRARFMCADSWHYYYFKPLEGYRAYREILSAYSENPAAKARAWAEIAGCFLELARSQKASFQEVRRACQQLHEAVPPGFTRAHAVADLIYGESYIYEGKFRDGKTSLEGLEERYPTRTREVSMSYLMQGYCCGKLGQWGSCKSYYERVIAMDLSNGREGFYWQGKPLNLKRTAAQFLVQFADEAGDASTKAQYQSYLDSKGYLDRTVSRDPSNRFVFANKIYEESE